jgi:hypothetical protein
MAIILKVNKVNLFVSSVLFVFWYHSPNFLDTPLILIVCSQTHLIRTPIDLRIACVKASVLLISRLYISEPAMLVNGVSIPRAWAIPIAIAVLPDTLKCTEHKATQ